MKKETSRGQKRRTPTHFSIYNIIKL